MFKDWRINWQIHNLDSTSVKTRRSAAKKLGEIGDARALEPLINILIDFDASVVLNALDALEKLNEPKWKQAVIRTNYGRYTFEDTKWRERIIQALSTLKDERGLNAIITALEDGDNLVRVKAAEAIQEFGDKRAVEPLINSLQIETEDWVKPYLIKSLGSLGDPRAFEIIVNALKSKRKDVRGAAAKALGDLGDHRAVSSLLEALKDNEIKEYAARSLGKLGDKTAILPLINLLLDEYDVVDAALNALEKLNESKWKQAVTPLIRKSQDQLLLEIAIALGSLQDDRVWNLFTSALKNSDKYKKGAAAAGLGKLGDRRAINLLISIFENENDNYVLDLTAKALGQFDDPRVFTTLIDALKRNNKNIRKAATAGLGVLGSPKAVDKLIEALEDNAIAGEAAIALGKTGDPRAITSLINFIESSLNRATWIKRDRHGHMMINEDRFENPQQLFSAVYALGNFADKRAIATLIKILGDSHNRLRYIAAEALQSIFKMNPEMHTSTIQRKINEAEYSKHVPYDRYSEYSESSGWGWCGD